MEYAQWILGGVFVLLLALAAGFPFRHFPMTAMAVGGFAGSATVFGLAADRELLKSSMSELLFYILCGMVAFFVVVGLVDVVRVLRATWKERATGRGGSRLSNERNGVPDTFEGRVLCVSDSDGGEIEIDFQRYQAISNAWRQIDRTGLRDALFVDPRLYTLTVIGIVAFGGIGLALLAYFGDAGSVLPSHFLVWFVASIVALVWARRTDRHREASDVAVLTDVRAQLERWEAQYPLQGIVRLRYGVRRPHNFVAQVLEAVTRNDASGDVLKCFHGERLDAYIEAVDYCLGLMDIIAERPSALAFGWRRAITIDGEPLGGGTGLVRA